MPRGTVRVHGRPVAVTVSARAAKLLAARPTVVELELYFSCLVRKRVRFREASPEEACRLEAGPAGVRVVLRPVASRACRVADTDGAPPLEGLPVERPEAFVPRWLRIDTREGHLWGDFGYATA